MVLYFDHIDSTNRVARQKALEDAPGGLIVRAGQQSAGRGQYDRSFASPSGGLYFSLLVRPDMPPARLPLITLAVGLACRDVLFAACRLEAQIKWPNDLYIGERKVAGILCENVAISSQGKGPAAVVIGVGLNVNSALADFSPELQPIVTTLLEHVGTPMDLDHLLADLVRAIEKNVGRVADVAEGLLVEWQRYDYLHGRPLVHTAGEVTRYGLGLGVSEQGLYRFRDAAGVEHSVVGGQLRPDLSGGDGGCSAEQRKEEEAAPSRAAVRQR